MAYFKKAKVGKKVYGMVFGTGVITEVFQSSHYKIMVSFENGYEIPYTDEGIPGWGNFSEQTLFYKKDIDITEYDFSALHIVLTPEKIIKLRSKKKLEVRLPSGIWSNCTKCTKDYVQEMLERNNFHLFRKQK